MNEFWRQRVIDLLERGESLEEIDRDLGHITSISEEHRDALWLLPSAYSNAEGRSQTGASRP